MGQTKFFLHASLSEYLILFGTPIRHRGPLGALLNRRCGTSYSTAKSGATRQARSSATRSGPATCTILGKGGAEGYAIPEACFMLEYARGPIPSMIAFGLFDSIFSTIDARTLGNTARYYTKLMVSELRRGKV